MRINIFGDFVAPTTNNLQLGSELRDMMSNSYNILNCEAPCLESVNEYSAIRKSGPAIYQSNSTPLWLKNNGFNLVSISNNHMMDFGEAGLDSTIKLFNNIACIGAGVWDDAYKPFIVEFEDYKVAFMALTQYEFGVLNDENNKDIKGTAWINHPFVDNIILETKKKVDFIILLAHAGVEDIEQPLPEWRRIYKKFIDLGCDAIVASHPHIIQGWEVYKDKPIIYSLGNMYFPRNQKMCDSWYHSICCTLSLSKTKIEFNITPIYFDNNLIDLNHLKGTGNYIKQVNKTLLTPYLYDKYINEECNKLLKTYDNLFLAGGYLNILKFYKILKPIAKFFLRKGNSHDVVHLLNNIRCESHRWCIIRGIVNKYNLE